MDPILASGGAKNTPCDSQLDFIGYWADKTVEGAVLRGVQLRQQKPHYLPERVYDSVKIDYIKSPSARKKPRKKYKTCKSPLRRSYSPARSSKEANYAKCRKYRKVSCGMRIAELAVPTKRQCLDTWRNNCHTLPAFMIERLRQIVLDQKPIVHISDAFTCFNNSRKKERKSKSAGNNVCKCCEKNKILFRTSDLKTMSAIFGHKIAKKLIMPMNITLNPDLEKVTSVVYNDIELLVCKSRKIDMCDAFNQSILMDITKKITIWVSDVLDESNENYLEDQIKDFEEEVGPVLDFLDDLIDSVLDICVPEPEVIAEYKISIAEESAEEEQTDLEEAREHYSSEDTSSPENTDQDDEINKNDEKIEQDDEIKENDENTEQDDEINKNDERIDQYDDIKESDEKIDQNDEINENDEKIDQGNENMETVDEHFEMGDDNVDKNVGNIDEGYENIEKSDVNTDEYEGNVEEDDGNIEKYDENKEEYRANVDKQETNIDEQDRIVNGQKNVNEQDISIEHEGNIDDKDENIKKNSINISERDENIDEHEEVKENLKINDLNNIYENQDSQSIREVKNDTNIEEHESKEDATATTINNHVENDKINNDKNLESEQKDPEIVDNIVQSEHGIDEKPVEKTEASPDNVDDMIEIFTDAIEDSKELFETIEYYDKIQEKEAGSQKAEKPGQTDVTWKASLDKITFALPNDDLLSDADESWPETFHALKPSQSVSKSITSLGNIKEAEERGSMTINGTVSTPDQKIDKNNKPVSKRGHRTSVDEHAGSAKQRDAAKETKKKSHTIDNKPVKPDKKKPSKTVKPDNLPGTQKEKVNSKRKQYKTSLEIKQLDTKTTNEDHQNILKLKRAINPKIIVEGIPLGKPKINKGGGKRKLSIQLQTRSSLGVINMVPNLDSEKSYKYNKIFSKTDKYRVDTKTAPTWVSRNVKVATCNIGKNKIEEARIDSDIRRWCSELEQGYKNLSIWNKWIEDTGRTVYMLQQEISKKKIIDTGCVECPERSTKKHWMKFKKHVDSDVTFWKNLNQSTREKIKSYRRIYQKLSQNPAASTIKCDCPPPK